MELILDTLLHTGEQREDLNKYAMYMYGPVPTYLML